MPRWPKVNGIGERLMRSHSWDISRKYIKLHMQSTLTCRFHFIAAQCPVVDHRFDGLNYFGQLLSTKESIRGNDPSNHNPCVYKHLFNWKLVIVLSAIAIEMIIQQLPVSGMEAPKNKFIGVATTPLNRRVTQNRLVRRGLIHFGGKKKHPYRFTQGGNFRSQFNYNRTMY